MNVNVITMIVRYNQRLIINSFDIQISDINYKNLGKITGEMAAEVLNGANVASMSVKGLTNFTLVINKKAAEKANITIPEALLAKADRVVEE